MQWLSRQVGVVTLIRPKTRRTGPGVQHVTIENSCLLNDLRVCLATQKPEEIVFPSYASLDRLTKAWLTKLLGAGHGLAESRAKVDTLARQSPPYLART
jgi:hypothetical protein